MTTASQSNIKASAEIELVDVVLDRPSFKAEAFAQRVEGTQDEKYTGLPVEGWVLGVGDFELTDEETGELRTITSYVIELTKPCKGFDRGAKTARDVKIGEQLRVVETAMLRQYFVKKIGGEELNLANHPTKMAYVRITPTFRRPQPNNAERKMWHYEIKEGKTTKARLTSGTSTAANLFAEMLAPAQLPAAN